MTSKTKVQPASGNGWIPYEDSPSPARSCRSPPGSWAAVGAVKRRQSSRRICVEHTNAEVRHWRPLQRYTGRRETYGETHLAIAALVSDRAAKRPTRHKPSTELVHIRATAC